jgi:uncharacterized Zn finger protein
MQPRNRRLDNRFVPNDLSQALNDAVVRRLAGDRAYNRGRDYFIHGRVESIEADTEKVRASVRGEQGYRVELSADEGVLDYSCDCPVGAGGTFCEHCAAVALAWLGRPIGPVSRKRRGKPKKVTLAHVGKVLLAEEKEAIVETLLDWAKTDERLRERLILYAAQRTGPDTAIAAVQQAFHKAVTVRGFVQYREMPSYARGVNDAIDSIEKLLLDGHAASVVELCERALGSLLEQMGSVDDSDGYMSELLHRLEDIHRNACSEARPEPLALARRLFDCELNSDYEVFYGAASNYSEVLGDKGIQEYRRLAEEVWVQVPVRPAGARDSSRNNYFRITHIMETLARLSGDLDELVAVMSKDLSLAWHYLQIAEACKERGKREQAMDWAERGLKAFPDHTDIRLREFLAAEYHRLKRHDVAMNLIWAEFRERPGLESYRILEQHAKKAGNWTEWREKAISEIQRGIESRVKSDGRPKHAWMRARDDNSPLVEIFLYERDIEGAWREAQAGGCRDTLWLQLAAAREEDHAEDAAPIYIQQAEAGVQRSAYDDAVKLLVKAAALMQRLDRSDEFVRILEALRLKYKIKRNFIKSLDCKQKLLYLS